MLELLAAGHLKKMNTEHTPEQVCYQLPLDDQLLNLNDRVGQSLRLQYVGDIHCSHCGRKTKKSFAQGHCYPCMQKLASCDSCIMSPERCHYAAGTCREPEWGESFCMTDHIVYLANSSGIKVGITRVSQVPTRWMDQGAVAALPIMRVATRQLSGLVEVLFKEHVADKTNWRTMLKGEVKECDLVAEADRLFELVEPGLKTLRAEHGDLALLRLDETEEWTFDYPVLEYPKKVASHNFDKDPVVEGVLQGIKGQYLIFDTGVINIRKFGSYHIEVYGE